MSATWLRTSVLVVAAGLSIATAPPPSWTVSDNTQFVVELSEPAPSVSFAVSVTYDVPDEDTELVLSASAEIERSIGAGETLSVTLAPDDGLGGGDQDARDLGRTLTVVTARAELGYCGRPCTRDFIATITWTGAPFADVASVDLEFAAFATGGDTTEVPEGAAVTVLAELLE